MVGAVVVRRLPLVVLRNREERALVAAALGLDNRSHKRLHEAGHFEQRRPQFVDHVDHETFDVRAVRVCGTNKKEKKKKKKKTIG